MLHCDYRKDGKEENDMPQLTAYLSFDGNCAEAMRTYERALGGKINVLMTNGQSPIAEHVPPGNEDRILHARLDFDGGVLMAGDAMAGAPYEGMKGFNVTLNYPTADDARPVYDALSDGATNLIMPFGESFWADGFGMFVDRFGTPWIINGGMRTGWEKK
jgi:PhnB protein